jgi:hypothetical protein
LKLIIVMPTKSINSQGISTAAECGSVAESVAESVADIARKHAWPYSSQRLRQPMRE